MTGLTRLQSWHDSVIHRVLSLIIAGEETERGEMRFTQSDFGRQLFRALQ